MNAAPAIPVQSADPEEAMVIVSIANQKGGVGKTTTAIDLAAAMALRGKRRLPIDPDPQANRHHHVRDLPPVSREVYDGIEDPPVLEGGRHPADVESRSCSSRRRASGSRNSRAAGGGDGRPFRLKDRLEPVREDLRLLVIDCPPALGLLTVNAVLPAMHLLIPIQSCPGLRAGGHGRPARDDSTRCATPATELSENWVC